MTVHNCDLLEGMILKTGVVEAHNLLIMKEILVH